MVRGWNNKKQKAIEHTLSPDASSKRQRGHTGPTMALRPVTTPAHLNALHCRRQHHQRPGALTAYQVLVFYIN